MSPVIAGTPRLLQPAITQRHIETEVAKCVGGVLSPLLANLFMHYAFDRWMDREEPGCPFERYADDGAPRTRLEVAM
jgi:retron-type reverse transcriptase